MVKPLAFYRQNTAIRIISRMVRGFFKIEGANALPGASKGVPEKGVPKFNWEEKIAFAASPEEMLQLAESASRILQGRETKLEFSHYPEKVGYEGEPKTMSLVKAEAEKGERVYLNLSQGEKKVAVTLGRGDLYALATLIPIAVAVMWEWTEKPHFQEEETSSEEVTDDDIPF